MTQYGRVSCEKLVKSISYDQSTIIKDILELHVPKHKIDCDPTYSKGNFYKGTGINKPELRFDIIPESQGVQYADCRDLPIESGTLECMIFDPPFLATTGKSLLKEDSSNKINKRFGVYPSEKELHRFYIESLHEAHRVLKEDGILIFKCQDKISSGKQYMSHVFIMNAAVEEGFYPKDLFILLAKNRIVADWQVKNQKNARKYHCYFWVFQKCDKKVEYI